MSDETVVETDGVAVSKFFNAEDFPVPAVAFDVDSSREEAVTLRIVDEIPEEFGIDQIGFHPEYGSEHWTASGDGVVRFEREIESGESFTTVYGVRMEDDQDETPFLSAPTVELDGDDIDDVVPPESTSVVRELASGERDTVPGLGDDAELETEVEAGVESLEAEDAEILDGDTDLGDPDDESGVTADANEDEPVSTESDESEDDEEPVTEPEAEGFGAEQPDTAPADDDFAQPEGEGFGDETAEADAGADDAVDADAAPAASGFDASDVAGALADAIRNDEVSDEDLETIEEAFGGVPNSTQVEIEHLQSRLSELEAYADALEEFIDEEGTAQEFISDVEDDVAGLSEELSALSAELADVSEEVSDVESSVEDAADDRAAIDERVADVEDEVGAIGDVREDLERVRGDVEAIDERLADTEDAVLDVEDLEDDVDDLDDDLEALEDHVDEIEQWRSQLSDVFGT